MLEEEAHVLGDGRVVAEEVLEHGAARVAGMDALRHLRELHRVAEQDERPRARPERERVGERGLAGLVDEEVVELPVELLAREEPGRAGEELRRPARRTSLARCSDVLDQCPAPCVVRSSRCRPSLLQPAERDALRERAASISESSLWIALWLCEATPTRLPRASRCVIRRAPVHVLPAPGGPWTKRYEPSTSSTSGPSPRAPRAARARRRAAARGAGASRGAGSGRRRRASDRPTRMSAACCSFVDHAPPGMSAGRQRDVLERRPAPQPQRPRDRVERDDAAPRSRIVTGS